MIGSVSREHCEMIYYSWVIVCRAGVSSIEEPICRKKILCSVWCMFVGGAVGMACGGCELRWHLRTETDIHWVVSDGCVGACGTSQGWLFPVAIKVLASRAVGKVPLWCKPVSLEKTTRNTGLYPFQGHCVLFPERAVPHRTGIIQHRTNIVHIKYWCHWERKVSRHQTEQACSLRCCCQNALCMLWPFEVLG